MCFFFNKKTSGVTRINVKSIRNGYLCSTCDPFLCLVCQLFKLNICHNYNGYIHTLTKL